MLSLGAADIEQALCVRLTDKKSELKSVSIRQNQKKKKSNNKKPRNVGQCNGKPKRVVSASDVGPEQ